MIVKNVVVKFGDRTVLDIEEFEFSNSGITVILGPNGAGKTTFLKALSGITSCDGMSVEDAPKITAYMAQRPYLFNTTVLKNITISMDKDSLDIKMAENALEELGIKHLKDQKATKLSGGEKQRVAIARTMITKPNMVFLDEPTSAADVGGVLVIEKYLRKLADQGVGIIMTTHNPSQAIRIADHAIMMWNGKIVESSTPKELLMNPKTPQSELYAAQWRTDI